MVDKCRRGDMVHSDMLNKPTKHKPRYFKLPDTLPRCGVHWHRPDSDATLKRMLGNAMHLPSAGIVLMVALGSVQPHRQLFV